MQSLVVVGLIVEEISNFDVKCVKVTGARNIGQGHWYLQNLYTEEKHYAWFDGCRPYS